MTINEIESTLKTLTNRHSNLDEEMLITLLTAGGWEEKLIKDAVAVFRGSTQKKDTVIVTSPEIVLLKTEITHNGVDRVIVNNLSAVNNEIKTSDISEKYVQENTNSEVSEIVYYDNKGEEETALQNFPNQEVELLKVDDAEKEKILHTSFSTSERPLEIVVEPQSLIEPKIISPKTEVDLPDNLPLKPFESSPHVWPLSKYKEVFHGDVMTPLSVEERALVNETEKQEIPESVVKKVKLKRTGFDGEDEGLIFLTGTALLVILLLLAYMYSNGRI